MSVQVSYKNQFVLGILLLIIFLVVIELVVNIWLYYSYKCDFEENEIFKDVNEETKRKICIESIGLDYTKLNLNPKMGTGHKAIGGIDDTVVKINSEGFRSPEYLLVKPEKTFRIFVMGGSTAFGAGVLDNNTFPYYLQEMFDNTDLQVKVEVINAGWVGWWSLKETNLIKEKLLHQEPDLFIVYDGWNELNQQLKGQSKATPALWMERWNEICGLGKDYGYDTIITLQPTAGTGERILTEQEFKALTNNKSDKDRLELYPSYTQKLEELNNCTVTADLRNLFDNIEEPIYYDVVHTGPKGNQIIAEKFFDLSWPLVIKKSAQIRIQEVSEEEFEPTYEQYDSNEFETIFEESSNFVRKLIFSYKTPRIIPLIFQQ